MSLSLLSSTDSLPGPNSRGMVAVRTRAARTLAAHRELTAWLGMRDSNYEMSSQIIPLKGRADSWNPAEFRLQRQFAFELRHWAYAAPRLRARKLHNDDDRRRKITP